MEQSRHIASNYDFEADKARRAILAQPADAKTRRRPVAYCEGESHEIEALGASFRAKPRNPVANLAVSLRVIAGRGTRRTAP